MFGSPALNAVLLTPQTRVKPILWLDATSITGLADGAAISTWTDSSGKGNDATGTLTSRPLYKTNIVNSKPVVRFDGTNDYLTVANEPTFDLPTFTIFVVGTASNDGGTFTSKTTFAGGVGDANRRKLQLRRSSSSQFVLYSGSDTANKSMGAVSWSGFNIMSVVARSATDYSLALNGAVSTYSSPSLDLTAMNNSSLVIGAATSGAEFLNGDIAEILIYNRALSATERMAVESYLAAKWGITLAVSNPRVVSGLTAWYAADQLVLNDGDPVASWSDLSGNSNHATQGTTAAKPLYKASIVNGRPAVLFDGVDDWLALTAAVGTILTSAAKTVFVVSKLVAAVSNSRIFSVSNAALNSTRSCILLNGAPEYQTSYTTGSAQGNFSWSGIVASTSVAQILEVVQSGTSISGRVNGTQYGSANDAGSEAAGSGAALGSGANGWSGFLSGYVLEFIVYNRALSTTEATAVRRYLGARYGLAVS